MTILLLVLAVFIILDILGALGITPDTHSHADPRLDPRASLDRELAGRQ